MEDLSPASRTVDLIGSRFDWIGRLGPGPNDTALFRTRMAPGKLVPLHSHIDPEFFYVLAGRLDIFLLDDRPGWHEVGTGCSLLVADGIRHASRNATDQPADIVLATNNRFANFLFEAGRPVSPTAPFAPASPDDLQRILHVSAKFGYWNATPAESATLIDDALRGT